MVYERRGDDWKLTSESVETNCCLPRATNDIEVVTPGVIRYSSTNVSCVCCRLVKLN